MDCKVLGNEIEGRLSQNWNAFPFIDVNESGSVMDVND